MTKNKWTTLMYDTDFLEAREVAPGVFQFISRTDMIDACGQDADPNEPFVTELCLVDLNAVSDETKAQAFDCCGWKQDGTLLPLVEAEMCYQYGAKAPLGSWSGKNKRQQHRDARREARALLDADALEGAMRRPVNKLGSTADEYMRGDTFAAMQRGAEAGDPTARLMAKMYGIPQDKVDDVRPEDWLPYLMGYQDAIHGAPESDSLDLADEYRRGYARGLRVKRGECPSPGWILETPRDGSAVPDTSAREP